ncbi:MAG: hypothetical protein EP330_12450 [Deltaproteobacteria bacterium]|nr:MAG: hypothetical protein EP330_12450 [Deltaproteobacteria bacterium]
MTLIWLCAALAADIPDVRQDLGSGAWINWSDLTVEVEARAQAGGVATFKSAEAEARRVLGPRLAAAARQVSVDGKVTLGDLEEGPAMGESVATRLARWSVGEARYHASGRIELVGQLDLRELLKPWTLASAVEAPENPDEPAYTGLVIDARKIAIEPTWTVELTTDEGEILWEGSLWEDVAYERAPVVYVSDAAHEAAGRAGNNPLFLTAGDATPGRVMLGDGEVVKLRTALSRSRILGDGRIVVVVAE